MSNLKKILAIGCVLTLGTSACNLPSQNPGTATAEAELAATATAFALTLLAETAQTAITELPSSTPLPSETATTALTSTPSVPTVRVSVDTNCRTGPSIVYDRVGGLLVGEEAVVVGKYSGGNYWIINNPDAAGTCWLWGEYATVSGNTAGLADYTAPPSPTPTFTPTPTITTTPSNTPTPTPSATNTP
jgi:hypothetical protein